MQKLLFIGLTGLACFGAQGAAPLSAPAYTPGVYGKVKNAPMYVCWREWDGEIRIGGVAKSLSIQASLGDVGQYFAVEIQGASGCANHEQLLFGTGTTNIVVGTNYTGTIQIGTNFYTRKDFADLAVIPRGNFDIWRARTSPVAPAPADLKNWQLTQAFSNGDAVARPPVTQATKPCQDTKPCFCRLALITDLDSVPTEKIPAPTTNWLGSVITGERLGGGKPNGLLDMKASDEQIGLRDDGVVVWRRRP